MPQDGFSRWFYGGTPPDDALDLPAPREPAARPPPPEPQRASTQAPQILQAPQTPRSLPAAQPRPQGGVETWGTGSIAAASGEIEPLERIQGQV
jgi:hypothetical protein